MPRLSINSQTKIGRADLPVGQDARQRVPSIALHPGSGSEKKNWPEEKWANLLEHLVNTTESGFLVAGGEAEGERLQRLTAALPPTRVRVAQSLPLAELARLLQSCSAFVGHDSGISHLAAALGVPAVILWGVTTEDIWRPPQATVRIVKHREGLHAITVKQVAETLVALPA